MATDVCVCSLSLFLLFLLLHVYVMMLLVRISEKFVINIQISSVLQSNYFLSIIDQQYSDNLKQLNLIVIKFICYFLISLKLIISYSDKGKKVISICLYLILCCESEQCSRTIYICIRKIEVSSSTTGMMLNK